MWDSSDTIEYTVEFCKQKSCTPTQDPRNTFWNLCQVVGSREGWYDTRIIDTTNTDTDTFSILGSWQIRYNNWLSSCDVLKQHEVPRVLSIVFLHCALISNFHGKGKDIASIVWYRMYRYCDTSKRWFNIEYLHGKCLHPICCDIGICIWSMSQRPCAPKFSEGKISEVGTQCWNSQNF